MRIDTAEIEKYDDMTINTINTTRAAELKSVKFNISEESNSDFKNPPGVVLLMASMLRIPLTRGTEEGLKFSNTYRSFAADPDVA